MASLFEEAEKAGEEREARARAKTLQALRTLRWKKEKKEEKGKKAVLVQLWQEGWMEAAEKDAAEEAAAASAAKAVPVRPNLLVSKARPSPKAMPRTKGDAPTRPKVSLYLLPRPKMMSRPGRSEPYWSVARGCYGEIWI